MREKITKVSLIVDEFINYLGSKQSDPRSWYFALVQVMRHNAVATLKKLDHLDRYLLYCLKNNSNPAEFVENKLLEYAGRVQEVIQSCLLHEQLEYRVASPSYSTIVKQKSDLLEQLSQKLKEVIQFPANNLNYPKKHWLSEEWKKVEAGLHGKTAMELTLENKNEDSIQFFQTLMFTEKHRKPVIMVTSKTRALNQDFGKSLKKAAEEADCQNAFALALVSSLPAKKSKL